MAHMRKGVAVALVIVLTIIFLFGTGCACYKVRRDFVVSTAKAIRDKSKSPKKSPSEIPDVASPLKKKCPPPVKCPPMPKPCPPQVKCPAQKPCPKHDACAPQKACPKCVHEPCPECPAPPIVPHASDMNAPTDNQVSLAERSAMRVTCDISRVDYPGQTGNPVIREPGVSRDGVYSDCLSNMIFM